MHKELVLSHTTDACLFIKKQRKEYVEKQKKCLATKKPAKKRYTGKCYRINQEQINAMVHTAIVEDLNTNSLVKHTRCASKVSLLDQRILKKTSNSTVSEPPVGSPGEQLEAFRTFSLKVKDENVKASSSEDEAQSSSKGSKGSI